MIHITKLTLSDVPKKHLQLIEDNDLSILEDYFFIHNISNFVKVDLIYFQHEGFIKIFKNRFNVTHRNIIVSENELSQIILDIIEE